jgi:hypothetical protein
LAWETNLVSGSVDGDKSKMMNIIQAFKAVAPILRNTLKSGQFFDPQCELAEPNPDILCEYDVRIPMSEGFSVIANIKREEILEKRYEVRQQNLARRKTIN